MPIWKDDFQSAEFVSCSMNMDRTPQWMMRLYPKRLWRMPADRPVLYLTFDDGPSPGITERLLDMLESFGAKASFFLVGDKVALYPGLTRQLRDRGHALGNHTQHHLNGWKTPTARYLEDVELASQSMSKALGYAPSLFRPPYGKAGGRSARALSKAYRIVMWDVMPGDFMPQHSAEMVAEKVIANAGPGSVVVLHDSEKCGEKMLEALPKILRHFAQKGFRFEALPEADAIP